MDKTRIHKKLARDKATIAIYQYLLTEATSEDLDLFLSHQEDLKDEDLEFAKTLIHYVLNSKVQYIELLNKYLKDKWTFDRLPKMEEAILLIATAEILETDLAKEVIVNEAVNNTKKYCDPNSYKYINAVLGNID